MYRVESSQDFEKASQLCEINGSPAYLFKEFLGNIFVQHGEKRYGPYVQATFLHPFKEGIVFCASEGNQWAVYCNGKKVTGEYEDILAPVLEFKDKPLFAARQVDGWKVFLANKAITEPYAQILQVRVIGQSILFGARKKNGKMCIVTIKDDQVREGTEYEKVGSPIVVNSKVVFPAQKSEDIQVVVYDGQEVAVYEEIGRLMEVNNKLIVTARKAEKEWIVSHEGKEYGPYSVISNIINYNDNFAYGAQGTQKLHWQAYLNGKNADESPPPMAGIGWMTKIGGELGYVYLNRQGWCSVRVGKKDIGKDALTMKYLSDFNGKPAYACGYGKNIPRWKIAVNGEEFVDEFSEILGMVSIKKELYALAVKPTLRVVLLKITEG